MAKKTFLSLIVLFTSALLFAQTGKPFPAGDLKITWEVVENNYLGKVQNQTKLTFTNTGKQTLPASGWKIYFNFGRIIKPDMVTGNVAINRINGELFELGPKEGFSPLAPQQSFTTEFVSDNWVVNYTDAPIGFYMFWETTGEYADMTKVNVIPSTTDKQLKRRPEDNIGLITPEILYAQNREIKDIDADGICPILPTPVMYKRGTGTFDLTAATKISDPANSNAEAGFLAKTLGHIFGTNFSSGSEKGDNTISLVRKELDKAEAYELSVSENGIEIRANDGAGFFYGIQSLIQLMPGNVFAGKQTAVKIPVVEVADAPRFGYRALHFDVSRNFRTQKEVLKVLNVMSLYKMNTFHFHFSDDDGWRIEMPSLPELTEVGSRRGAGSELEMLLPTYGSGGNVNNTTGTGHYTEAEFIEILKYAAERHIQVIPEVETPGHARAAIKAMEARYHKYMKEGNRTEAERYRLIYPGDKSEYLTVQSWNDNIMDVSMESIYNFIERVVDDIAAIYQKAGVPLHTIHMGGDEVPDGVWEKSPAFAEIKKQNSEIKEAGDLWYYYFDRVSKILKDRNLFLSGWEEAGVRFVKVDGVKNMVPNPDFADRHFQLDVWNNVLGWGAEDLAYKLANAGYKVVLSCVSNNYLDMSYYKAFDEPGYYWGSYVDIDKPFSFIPFDYYKNSIADLNGNPIPTGAFDSKERLTEFGKTNIVGVKGLLWSETLTSMDMVEYMLLPKLISSAERSWSVDPDWATEYDKTKSDNLYASALYKYYNTVGKFHLNRLDYFSGGYNYRIPAPGVLAEGGKAYVNMQLPGFTLRYTTDGKEPDTESNVYAGPIDFTKGTLKVKAFNSKGRGSRTITVTK